MEKIKSYIIWGLCMLSITGFCFLILTHFLSCYGKQKEVEVAKPVFVEEHTDKLSNFVFLIKESHSLCIADEESSCDEEPEMIPVASASGLILSSSTSHIFILTANHFCETSNIEKVMGEIKIRAFIGESKRLVDVVTYTSEADLCLLQGLKYNGEEFKTTILAKEMPLIGERVINVAAPDGMASPHTRLMFDGIFAGCENFQCIYTVPATFGSSGSAVYNEKGELISVLVAAATNFENVSMGPHVILIQTLVDTVQKEIDIY
tara:strand:- start:12950 stop:13738 length:789 start_codon:yes stop_codon:yes gene_type:complete